VSVCVYGLDLGLVLFECFLMSNVWLRPCWVCVHACVFVCMFVISVQSIVLFECVLMINEWFRSGFSSI